MNESRTDSKSLMVKFNEQLQPLFGLLREVEDIKLAPSILEPEPTDIKALRCDINIISDEDKCLKMLSYI